MERPTGDHTSQKRRQQIDPSSAREAAKNRVIAAGNAQAVFNRLGEVEADRPANLNRWVWELLQNARDAAGTLSNVAVAIAITFDGATLTFQHDGLLFAVLLPGSRAVAGIAETFVAQATCHCAGKPERLEAIEDHPHDGGPLVIDLQKSRLIDLRPRFNGAAPEWRG